MILTERNVTSLPGAMWIVKNRPLKHTDALGRGSNAAGLSGGAGSFFFAVVPSTPCLAALDVELEVDVEVVVEVTVGGATGVAPAAEADADSVEPSSAPRRARYAASVSPGCSPPGSGTT